MDFYEGAKPIVGSRACDQEPNLSVLNMIHSEYQQRPTAPWLSGLFSLESVSERPDAPIVIVYGGEPRAAKARMNEFILQGGFSRFLLRRGPLEWEIYDGDGFCVEKRKDVEQDRVGEVPSTVEIDRTAFQEEARSCTGIGHLSLLVAAEGHAGACAADHSNFVLISRRMIVDAKAADLEQVFVVKSNRWPCPVVGIFANVASLSAEMQDLYLDRWKWLNHSWPLVSDHHKDMLADRMTKVRGTYVQQLLEDCGRSAGMSGERILEMQTKWHLASRQSKYQFCQQVVSRLEEGLLFAPGEAETFDPEVVVRRGADAVRNWRGILQ